MLITYPPSRSPFLPVALRCLCTFQLYKFQGGGIRWRKKLCWENMSLILLLKMHFPLSNEVLDYQCHYEQVRNIGLQKPWKLHAKTDVQKWVYIHTVAATILACPTSGCSDYCCTALACRGFGQRFSAVCSGPNSLGGCGINSYMALGGETWCKETTWKTQTLIGK